MHQFKTNTPNKFENRFELRSSEFEFKGQDIGMC